jgi:motility quorum-sensing regulator/GCU-specific mRNA interferase toxin
MEKHTPHYPLSLIKELLASGKARATKTALIGGAALGFDAQEMMTVVAGLTSREFYKSMTSYRDHRFWQDVYRPMTRAGAVYLKLTVMEGLLIVSFKEA